MKRNDIIDRSKFLKKKRTFSDLTHRSKNRSKNNSNTPENNENNFPIYPARSIDIRKSFLSS